MADTNLTGRRAGPTGRRPRIYGQDRICAAEGCTTTLSKYNRSKHCYVHAPVRFPRTRGRVLEDR